MHVLDALVHTPAIVRGDHVVTTDDLVESFLRNNPQSRYAGRVENLAANTLIIKREWARPLSEIEKDTCLQERNRPAVEAMLTLAERALRQALRNAGCTATDIDVLITSNSTTPGTPGVASWLIEQVGLRADVTWIPMTQLGCVGGAHCLALAAQLASGGRRVAVVVPEMLHTVFQLHPASVDAIIHNLLYGDAACACVVEGDAEGPGFHIRRTWNQHVRDSFDAYQLITTSAQQKFTSETSAPDRVLEIKAPLWQWLRQKDPTWEPDVIVAHPGGRRILEHLEDVLECDSHQLRHAWRTYVEHGNQGGGTVLHELSEVAEEGPADGARLLLVGVGPGFAGAACTGYYSAPAAASETPATDAPASRA